jgi:hypothetical protein
MKSGNNTKFAIKYSEWAKILVNARIGITQLKNVVQTLKPFSTKSR